MRARTIGALVGAAALTLATSACIGGGDDDGPVGPNGYTLAGTIEGTEVEVWYDYAEDAELTDIVLMDGDDIVGLCLGGPGTACYEGDIQVESFAIVIAPEEAVRAELVWAGAEPIEMLPADDGIDDGMPHVFVVAPPLVPEGVAASPQVTLYNEADEPL